jgi:DNA-directed RNA polymerase specialized sigma24 family protein
MHPTFETVLKEIHPALKHMARARRACRTLDGSDYVADMFTQAMAVLEVIESGILEGAQRAKEEA